MLLQVHVMKIYCFIDYNSSQSCGINKKYLWNEPWKLIILKNYLLPNFVLVISCPQLIHVMLKFFLDG